jgi:hypothetical protein
MKIALFALGFIAAGVVGGVTADLLRPEVTSAPTEGGRDRLAAEIDDLRTDVAHLREEFRTARDAAVLPDEPAGTADAPLPSAAGEEIPSEEAVADGSGALEEKVNRLIEEKARKDGEARTKRIGAMWAERDKERLSRLKEDLDLTDYQAEELARILDERRKVMMEMRTKMFEGGRENLSREEITAFREKMQKSRDESEEKVKSLLSSSQYEQYRKLEPSGGGRGPGRGPGGGFGR